MNFNIDKSKINYISIIGFIILFIGMFLPVIEQNNVLGQYMQNTWQQGGWTGYIIWGCAVVFFAIKDMRIPCLVASLLLLIVVGVPRYYHLIGQYVMLVGATISLVGSAFNLYKAIKK